MAQFKKGDAVVQIMPDPIKGVVDSFAVDQETGESQVRVAYTDVAGQEHFRFFLRSELNAA